MPVLLAVAALCGACASSPRARAQRALDDGAYAQAARAYRAALVEEPNDGTTWLLLARAELAAGQPAAARQAATRATLLLPSNPQARVVVGESYELERNYPEAELAYRQAAQLAPADAYALRLLGIRLLRWGRTQDAIESLSQALAREPSHGETYNALGVAYAQLGDGASAERTFRAGIAHDPKLLDLRLGLAATLVNAGRLREALAVYDALVDLAPRFAAVHVGRALLLDALSRPQDAIAAFERAVAVADDPRPYRVRLRQYRALLAKRVRAPGASASQSAL